MLNKIEINNFRSLNKFKLDFSKEENRHIYFEGINGIGKTSILEAIYFANTTKSHRTTDEKEIISFNKPFSKVLITTSNNNQIDVIITSEGKRTFINKKEVNRLSEFIGFIPLVLFSPEDFKIINGTPSNKRYFLDLEITQINKKYLDVLSDYKKVLRHRNNLLKTIKKDDDLTFLNILGEQLAKLGSEIMEYRADFINNLNQELLDLKILPTKLIYKPNVVEPNDYIKQLKSRTEQDFILKTTTVGIHRDDFEILINEEDGRKFGSQGQKRLIVILIKLALAKYLTKIKNTDIILLLDDVLSELDFKIQQSLLTEILKYKQVIMTGAIPLNNDKFKTIQLTKEMIQNE